MYNCVAVLRGLIGRFEVLTAMDIYLLSLCVFLYLCVMIRCEKIMLYMKGRDLH
jgi:hypothetical protein